MTMSVVDRLMKHYEHFDPALIESLEEIYDKNIVFQDPIHKVEGLPDLRRYFGGLMEGLEECRFAFNDRIEVPGKVVLVWTMTYRHARLKGGKTLTLDGSSHLKVDEKVVYHRDYYDVGTMLYEHVPVLGFVIRQIKSRLEG
ncbi:nuclear transport factor 2 family protein [Marinimicrobium sp. ARAG 43.8]|uniref:nuclear transport factor 2 family protein n=1 Tax=Marinimicrobium sp. ARAG 43.8 TaxID=3418719 RepID=UPI003CEBDFC5